MVVSLKKAKKQGEMPLPILMWSHPNFLMIRTGHGTFFVFLEIWSMAGHLILRENCVCIITTLQYANNAVLYYGPIQWHAASAFPCDDQHAVGVEKSGATFF